MAPRTNVSYVLAERPEGEIVPGKTFQRKTGPAPTDGDLEDGQVLIKALYFSVDPAMRVWINEKRGYTSPVPIGGVMRASLLARVLASKSAKARAGDIVVAHTGWQEYAVANENQFTAHPLPSGANISDLLGVLGLTGLTAHIGLTKIGEVKKGDTVVVSSAAGATGSIVGQIAKLRGAGKVIGITGSDEKCKWLTDVAGFDAALNYRDLDFDSKFEEATPDLIDVYWDNVGSHILDLALGRAAQNARFVECGMIDSYNSTKGQNLKNLSNVILKRIKIQGFIYADYVNDVAKAREELGQWLGEGKIRRAEHIIKGSIDDLEAAWKVLYSGGNIGKLIVQVNDPEE